MGDGSTIEWTDATWNPMTGCTRVSEGCRNCYMARTVPRQGQDPWTVVLHPDRIDKPLRWKRPRRIFVNSLSDLFHEDVPDSFIEDVYAVMFAARHHTFQILTKRPERAKRFLEQQDWGRVGRLVVQHNAEAANLGVVLHGCGDHTAISGHIWIGVSVEDQATADARIPLLLQTPAAVRFVSVEPMLGPVSLRRWLGTAGNAARSRGLDWVIVGGESGPGARPMDPTWARSLRDQCVAAGVPYFFKQHGEYRERTEHDPKRLMDPWVGGRFMTKVGKKSAGRVLDGRTWDELPA